MIGGMGEPEDSPPRREIRGCLQPVSDARGEHKLDVLKRHCEREKANYDDMITPLEIMAREIIPAVAAF